VVHHELAVILFTACAEALIDGIVETIANVTPGAINGFPCATSAFIDLFIGIFQVARVVCRRSGGRWHRRRRSRGGSCHAVSGHYGRSSSGCHSRRHGGRCTYLFFPCLALPHVLVAFTHCEFCAGSIAGVVDHEFAVFMLSALVLALPFALEGTKITKKAVNGISCASSGRIHCFIADAARFAACWSRCGRAGAAAAEAIRIVCSRRSSRRCGRPSTYLFLPRCAPLHSPGAFTHCIFCAVSTAAVVEHKIAVGMSSALG